MTFNTALGAGLAEYPRERFDAITNELARGAGPEAFAKFGRAGYVAPYVESDTPAFTFAPATRSRALLVGVAKWA